MIKLLRHTNSEMDTVVTIVISHNDTSKVAVRGGEGTHGHKYFHRLVALSLKEKTDELRTLKHTAAAYTYCSRAKGHDAMTWLWLGHVCKREGRVRGWLGVVPFQTSSLDRKCLLLGVHVQQQVSNTVTVAILIIIPERDKERKNRNQVHLEN